MLDKAAFHVTTSENIHILQIEPKKQKLESLL